MKIIVPATSANIGPGFDSVGVALSKYLEIVIMEPSKDWFIEHDLGENIPTDASNLLIKTALRVTSTIQPHRIKMISDVPLARGLGSSSSVIVAGIELANQLANLNLTADEKLAIATEIEGHPDNVAPAIFGNLVISSYLNQKVSSIVADFPETAFIAFIPNYELKTSDSRGVLPSELSYKEAVAASSVANVAIAALLTGDLVKAGQAIQGDLFHERFRQQLVKEFSPIKALAKKEGAYATYLSGAGPTVMVLASKDKEETILAGLKALQLDGQVCSLRVDTNGVIVED
ncbi:homoserine kinase [Streptococcus orisratti]|uniref:homoserine kinase n=1 Tax=Streptococcus TaxID=1301 RepID=UPI00037E86F5|nr:homoserine kinase [Streptococcus orisratti]MCI7677046.1 homoserine kinase [Streptococcus orisratti]MDY4002441.1 homoserine kinase [Streptococcus orisratti]MDY5635214.1 homoserine kinase [Streptococcus orisratti]